METVSGHLIRELLKGQPSPSLQKELRLLHCHLGIKLKQSFLACRLATEINLYFCCLFCDLGKTGRIKEAFAELWLWVAEGELWVKFIPRPLNMGNPLTVNSDW